MALDFQSFILVLEELGVVDVLLPFLIIFALVFAVLQKSKVLGENKNINMIISLVIGLSVVIPHVTDSYPAGADVVDMMNVVMPQVSLIAIAFVMLLVLIGTFGVKWHGKPISGAVVVVSIAAIVGIFGGAAGWWDSQFIYDIFGPEAISMLVMLLVFGLIIWFITSSEQTGQGAPAPRKLLDKVKDITGFLAGK